ncbi:unnamed protein product [Angiostrongylus costaricensis]|uniref:Uncharacterized protein n=1 Tax=Angiostrongylus costaricensis TaxID=334426 RepID=A0A0R3Q0L5_ANGCS|nr:unnamed protein product [Angiostrongylus costaricensis]
MYVSEAVYRRGFLGQLPIHLDSSRIFASFEGSSSLRLIMLGNRFLDEFVYHGTETVVGKEARRSVPAVLVHWASTLMETFSPR